jgi:two-component system sensor histidine kinase KdpD
MIRMRAGAIRDGPMRAAGAGRTIAGLMRVSRSLRAVLRPTLIGLILVAVATIGLMLIGQFFRLSFIPLVYLIPVIIAATRWGSVPALFTATAAAATADFFFYEPFYSFWISDSQQVADLILFLIVAAVTGGLAGRLRRAIDNSRRREKEVRELYAFSRRLAGCYTTSALYSAIQHFISTYLGRPVALMGAATAPNDHALPDVVIPQSVSRQADAVLAAGEFVSRWMTDDATKDVWLVRPLAPDVNEYGVIVVNLGSPAHHNIEASAAQIEFMLSDVTETLNRLNISKSIREAKLRTEAELLKDVLIGSVSHELRTPLASILGSASVLATVPEIQRNDNLAALAQGMHDEAKRLSGHLQKLLHAARIGPQGVQPKLSWTDPTDIINAAITQRSQQLGSHRFDVEMAPDLPLIRVDALLIEQALGEVLENAAKYSPIGSVITITARPIDDQVVLAVSDHGAGLTASEKSQLFNRSFRGDRHLKAIAGSGLGLWIANAFAVANGGMINAVSQGEGFGTTVSIHFPAGREADSALSEHVHE